MNDKVLYRIPEVAEHLSISRSKVYAPQVWRTPLSTHRSNATGPCARPSGLSWLAGSRFTTVGTIERQGRRPMPTTHGRRPILSKVRTFRLFLDLVAQKGHAVFEPGGLDQLQVLRILEHVRSLAA